DLVLDGAADAERQIELRLDDLAGLPALLGVGDPARIDGGPGGADRAAQLRGELLDDPEPVRSADAAATRDDDPRLLDRSRGARGGDAVDHRDLRQRQLADRLSRLD